MEENTNVNNNDIIKWALHPEDNIIILDKNILAKSADDKNKELTDGEIEILKNTLNKTFYDLGEDIQIDNDLLEIVKERIRNREDLIDIIASLCILTGLWKVL